MGMLDAIMKNPELLGDAARFASDNPEIAKAAMKLLSSDTGGGLGGLLSNLESGGLGDAVSSWLGSGSNKAIDPAKLKDAIGADALSGFAKDAGVSGSEASALLAGILPGLVDKLSPDGKLPDAGGLDSVLGGLLGSLGR